MTPADPPRPAAPVDSVQRLHAPLMEAMNDPVMLTPGAGPPDDDPAGAGGQDAVQAIHGGLMDDHAEPRDGFEPVPFWVLVVFAGLLLWGGYYAGSRSADFRPDVDDGSDICFPALPADPFAPPAPPPPAAPPVPQPPPPAP